MTIEIQLTQGQVAIVDDEDADLALFKWSAMFQPDYSEGGKYTAGRHTRKSEGKNPIEYMHRVILSRMLGRPLLRSELVDHEHSNPLDNRRSELRLATYSQNAMNIGRRADNTSGYKGVHWRTDRKRWVAQISVNGQARRVGSFKSREEAFEAYCKAGREHYGEFFNPGY